MECMHCGAPLTESTVVRRDGALGDVLEFCSHRCGDDSEEFWKAEAARVAARNEPGEEAQI